MTILDEELASFDKLIRVLEDALERAAEILGPNIRPPSMRSRHAALEDAFQIYEDLSDLLDASRAARLKLLEREPQ